MPAFDREIIESVTAACQVGQMEAARALGQALGGTWELTGVDAEHFALDPLPDDCQGPGFIWVLNVAADAAALVVLPESTRTLPSWWAQPGPGDRERLAQLAVELGRFLLPESHPAQSGQAVAVPDLPSALRRAGISADAARVAWSVRNESGSGVMSLIWPALRSAAIPADSSAAGPAPTDEAPVFQGIGALQGGPRPEETPWEAGPNVAHAAADPRAAALPESRHRVNCEQVEEGLPHLPPYSRSLLKIRVPVKVTLAESKQPIRNVLDMGPGSIIHFNKPCEDTLALEVAGQKVALGEAVKVGDKFGLWLTSMILPEERFWIISGRAQTERAK